MKRINIFEIKLFEKLKCNYYKNKSRLLLQSKF